MSLNPTPAAGRLRPPMQQRSEDTRLRILQAALEVFAAEGYDGASTRTLAQRAGVNLPALQYYFGSKEGLYRAVIDCSATRWSNASPRSPRRYATVYPTDRCHDGRPCTCSAACSTPLWPW